MKTNFLLILLLLSFHTDSFSQIPKVVWTEQDKEKEMPIRSFVMSNGDKVNFYNLGSTPELRKVKIKVYDVNNKLKKEIEHKEWQNPVWDSKDFVLQYSKLIDDRICIILSLKKDKKWKLFKNILTIDYKAGKELKQIGEIDNLEKGGNSNIFNFILNLLTFNVGLMPGGYYGNSDAFYLNISKSKDESKIVFFKPAYNKKETYINAICLNSELNKVYETKQKLENGDAAPTRIDKLLVTNQGDIVFGFTQYFKKKTHKEKFKIGIAKISGNGKNLKTKIYDDSKKAFNFDRTARLTIDQSKIINLTAKEDEKLDTRLDGFIIDEFDISSMTISKSKYYEIDEELLKKAYSTKQAKKNKIEKRGMKDNWIVEDLFSYQDNSILAILQEYDVITSSYTDSRGQTRTSYTYVYGDILVLKFGENNNIIWSRILYKDTRASERSGADFFLEPKSFLINEKLYLIYNDHSLNVSKQGITGDKSREKVFVKGGIKKFDGVLKVIDIEGNIDSKILVEGKSSDEILYPDETIFINNNQLYFTAIKNKKQRFGTMMLSNVTVPKMNNTESAINVNNPTEEAEKGSESTNSNSTENYSTSSPKSVIERLDIKDKENPSDEILEGVRKMKEAAEKELKEAGE